MRPNSPQRGFVLVLVLVALVVLGLLAAAVAGVSERAVREAQAESDAFAAEIDGIGTRDTLLYLLTTQRQTVGGLTVDNRVSYSSGQATASRASDDLGDTAFTTLPVGNEVKLDGTAYEGLGVARFALQDDAGLFSINWTSNIFRPGLFALLGVPPEQVPALETRRLDYQDADDLHRLDGAEAPDYREAGLPPPSNRTLVTPLELRRIPGWREALADRSDADLMRLFTTGWVVTFNVNTAPADALRIVPGVDAGTSARIVALRAKAPFVLEWQFIRDFQLPIDPFQPVTLLGAGSGTLSLWHNAGGPVDLLHWTLTPADAGGRPWRLDYEITLPSDEIADPNLVRPAPSPLLSPAPAPGP
ncbi:MAG: hypothetical protein ACTHOC_11670 [Luteimonas sp.]